MSASEESRAEIASILLNNEKKREKELADLRARSKPLHELVVSEYFNVEEVISHSGATSFTPHSERRMGGRSPVYDGGFTSELVLKVLHIFPFLNRSRKFLRRSENFLTIFF